MEETFHEFLQSLIFAEKFLIDFSDIKIKSRGKAVLLTRTQDDIQAVAPLLSTIIKDLEVRCIPIPSGKVVKVIGKGGRRIQKIR